MEEWMLTDEELREAIEKSLFDDDGGRYPCQAQAKKLVETADKMGVLNHSKYHNLDTREVECIPECRACELRRQVGLE